jgi:KaiC/GvpD/RAD55 family RecA-like ATPase
MELEKQRVLLSCMINSRELMALSSGMVKPSYFDPSLKKAVKFIKEYFEKYRDVPKASLVRAETSVIIEDVGEISRAEIKYVSEELEGFCRIRAALEAVISGPELIQKGDFEGLIKSLKDATSVGLQKDLGMDYFSDPIARLEASLNSAARILTGWKELDDALGGGVARQELITFLANSGGGKSMTMLNLAHNLLRQGLHGVYVSLEMSEPVVSKRLDSMISKVGQADLFKDLHKVADSISQASESYGKFIIKRFPEGRTTVSDVRSWLQQLEQATGFRPDFIVIDYIDIMGTTAQISKDNMFTKDKYVTEEIRGLGFDYDCIMISAAQLGRAAVTAEDLNQSHIQGGMSKINTSDYVVGIKQDDAMRAAGEIMFQIMKSRNSGGVGKKIHLGWDIISLLITSFKKAQPSLSIKKPPEITMSTAGISYNKPPDGPVEDAGILKLF